MMDLIYKLFLVLTVFISFVTDSDGFINKHVLSKRQTDTPTWSPSDRPSCKPGATVPATRISSTQTLTELRTQFTVGGVNIQGYIIPSEDAHQSEFPADYDKRRAYISGFTGSHGLAIVMRDQAALWTDGRYYTQAEDQLDCNWILMKADEPSTPSYEEWILSVLGSSSTTNGRTIGINPLYITSSKYMSMDASLKKENIVLQQINQDLVDKIWQFSRPQRPSSVINSLPLQFSGRSWQTKVTEDVYSAMLSENVDALILTQLDEIAWLFNLRGSDIQYNPFFMSYAILENMNGNLRVRLFILDKMRKLTETPKEAVSTLPLHQHLNTGLTGSCDSNVGMCVQVEDYNEFLTAVSILNSKSTIKKFWIPFQCNQAIYKLISKEKYQANTPVALKKFQKNPVEQEGIRNAHKRDAVALISYVAHLEDKVKNKKFPVATELTVSNDLTYYRSLQPNYRGISFQTISAFGPHSAVIHYKPTLATNLEITTEKMFLLDSGAQYLDGTTDVTRTFHFGEPSNFEKECYTRVLMGHIDLARFTFYKGLYGPYGREIDAIARRPLWEVGLDYRHGTGHGVGAYLSVHEGPGRISLAHPRVDYDVPLDEFQVFSDEPGFYQTNNFGIRLENMVMVKRNTTKYQFMDSVFLGFETFTLVPYEPHLIDFSLMTPAQIGWLNNYHSQVQRVIGPLLVNDTMATDWLLRRTQVIIVNSVEGLASSLVIMCVSVLTAMIIS